MVTMQMSSSGYSSGSFDTLDFLCYHICGFLSAICDLRWALFLAEILLDSMSLWELFEMFGILIEE